MKKNVQEELLNEGLCDWCISRYVGSVSKKVLKKAMENRVTCRVCRGTAFYDYRALIIKALEGRSFRTYSIGARVSRDMLYSEEKIVLKYGIKGYKPLKRSLIDKIAKDINEIVPGLFVKNRPDVLFVFNLPAGGVDVVERSYQLCMWIRKETDVKLTASPCRHCNGKGCSYCGWTGKENDGSFESFLLFKFPLIYRTSSPRITWPFKEILGLEIKGCGIPVYLSFSSALDRLYLPIKINFKPVSGLELTQVYTLNSRREYARRYFATFVVELLLKREISIEELKEIYKVNHVKLLGKTGKVWVKSLHVIQAEPLDHIIRITLSVESGISIYALLGLRSEATVKKLESPLFPEGVVEKILRIQLIRLVEA